MATTRRGSIWRVILAISWFVLSAPPAARSQETDWDQVMAQIPLGSPVAFTTMPNGSYGFGVKTPWQGLHTGSDFMGPQGTMVYAAGEGIVKWASWWPASMAGRTDTGHGPTVWIQHDVQNVKFCTVYAHMGGITVRVGQQVVTGTPLGAIGPMPGSGAGFGSHIHFAVWGVGECDPSLGNAIGGRWFDPIPMLALGSGTPLPSSVEAHESLVLPPGSYWQFDEATESQPTAEPAVGATPLNQELDRLALEITSPWGIVEVTLPNNPLVLVVAAAVLVILLLVAVLWER